MTDREYLAHIESAILEIKSHTAGMTQDAWNEVSSVVMATASTLPFVYSHITKEPQVCGGKACIDGTRIRVMDIVCLEREGYKPEEMLNVFASRLTLAQVHAALAYYYDNPDEIDAAFAEEEAAEAEGERARDEYLRINRQ